MNRKNSRSGTNVRMLRIGELVRHALVEILKRDSIQDPDLTGISITVTEARISPDLRNGSIYVLPLEGKDQDKIVDALNRNSGYIRGRLAKTVNLKYLPKLNFELDHSFDQADKLDSLLQSPAVRRDLEVTDVDES